MLFLYLFLLHFKCENTCSSLQSCILIVIFCRSDVLGLLKFNISPTRKEFFRALYYCATYLWFCGNFIKCKKRIDSVSPFLTLSQVPNSSSKLKSHPSFLLLIIKYSNLHPWSAFLLASAWQLLTSARVDKSDYCSAVLEMCVVFLFV